MKSSTHGDGVYLEYIEETLKVVLKEWYSQFCVLDKLKNGLQYFYCCDKHQHQNSLGRKGLI